MARRKAPKWLDPVNPVKESGTGWMRQQAEKRTTVDWSPGWLSTAGKKAIASQRKRKR